MRKSYSSSLFVLLLAILLSSCNTSLNVLKRKYRPGYSVNISNKNHQKQDLLKEQTSEKSQMDSLVEENSSDVLIACSATSDNIIYDYKSPTFIIPCDTPPQKKMDDPNWSLYKPKEPNPKGNSKWKPIEPCNLVSFFVLLLGVLIASFIPMIGAWFVFLIFLTIIILSIISLIRIKKNPNKYSKLSKVFDWVFISLGIGLLALSLIALVVILASVA